MRRRTFMAVLAGAITVATGRDAGAQQTPRVWRIGILDTAPRELNGPQRRAEQRNAETLRRVLEGCTIRQLPRCSRRQETDARNAWIDFLQDLEILFQNLRPCID